MIKKVIFVGLGVGLLTAIVFGTGLYTYVRTSARYVKQGMSEAVPVEFQIERARSMIQDITPEISQNMHVIAKEESELEQLEKQIKQGDIRLAKEREQMLKLKTDLAENKSSYRYGDRTYSAEAVRQDLAGRFERFKTGEATLTSLKQIRDAREKSLEAARRKFDGLVAAKRQLQVEVENLEARSQMVAAAKTTSSFQIDDSRLGNVKELVAQLKTRLDVSEKLVYAENQYLGEIPLDKPVAENIESLVTEYFSPKATQQVVVTETGEKKTRE